MPWRSLIPCKPSSTHEGREWLLTNSTGSLACGYVDGTRTRRYHGLLTVAHRPPAERRMELATVEAWLLNGDQPWPISMNRYKDCLYPDTRTSLLRFASGAAYAEWQYAAGGTRVHFTVQLANNGNGVHLTWTVIGASSNARLRLIPLLAMRDAHGVLYAGQTTFHRENDNQPFTHARVTANPGGRMDFSISSAACWRSDPDWYYRFDYPIERERGLEDTEDLWTPGTIECSIPPSGRVTLDVQVETPRKAFRTSRHRWQGHSANPLLQQLIRALTQFLMVRDNALSVVAGYPWFVDWGRDSMIVLRGVLCLEGGLHVATQVLRVFASAMRHGLLPNRYPDVGETPEYNTVDATLWFGVVVDSWMRRGGSRCIAANTLLPAMRHAFEAHLQGTIHGIRVDPHDGLLMAGNADTQLTWMDARAFGAPVTPRFGKPIEVAALWIAFCEAYARMERRVGESFRAQLASSVAEQARAAFVPAFWDNDLGWFVDCIYPDGTRDAALRPNQLIALGLWPRLAPHREACQALTAVRTHLLTPVGLRTLDPSHPAYHGAYLGPPDIRDQAYHQGCVWPWLWGPWLDAVAVNEGGQAARREANALARVVHTELIRNGLGTLPEIYDGDAPHTPRGCFAQAWSVSETLRALIQYGAPQRCYGKETGDTVQ